MNLGWPSVFALLNVAYFGLHYMFASQTAHVGALYTAFLAMMLAAGEMLLLALLPFIPTIRCSVDWQVVSLMRHSAVQAGLDHAAGFLQGT